MAATQQQLAPGSRFSIPPFTDEIEQPENNDGLITSFSQGTTTPVTGIIPFMQSDVMYGWILREEISETYTFTTAITRSPYFPWSHVGNFLLNMQYQYPSISVESGFDLHLVNQLYPLRSRYSDAINWGNVPYSGYSSQANSVYSNSYPLPTTGTVENVTFDLELPASVWFDEYYELDEAGNPLSGPHNGYVSPTNMGGYARVVTPSFKLNPLIPSTYDNGPYIATGTPSATGSVTHRIQRIGVLGNVDASVLPQPTNWQYNIAHQRWTLAGVSKITIPLNGMFAGQIMAIIVRLFDPAANSGAGAPISVNNSNITQYQITYGGNVQRFTGRVPDLQRRFFEQHRYIPEEGVLIFDMATDPQTKKRTNSYLINTLRTAAVNLYINFGSAMSTQAYAEVTIAGLRFVPLPVTPNQ